MFIKLVISCSADCSIKTFDILKGFVLKN